MLHNIEKLGLETRLIKAQFTIYDARTYVTLRRLHIDARRNAKQCKDRLGFYPCVPLRYVLASCHEKLVKV